MLFEQIDAGGDRNFSYLIGDEDTKLCAVVDPGYDTSKLEARVAELGYKVEYILNTHTHHDHIAGNTVFYKDDVKLGAYKDANVNSDRQTEDHISPDLKLDHGDEIQLGGVTIKILFTPGHYLDSICILAGDKLITGDTLFVGCIGGTGFNGSSAEKQYHSLFEVIMKLEDHVGVYPGHDYGERPFSTIGEERTGNPFLQQTDFNDFTWLKENWEEYKAEHGIP